jgi:hypothetical protein
MRATLTDECPELTRPVYSSMRFGGVPAACTMVGASINFGMMHRNSVAAAGDPTA